MRAEEILKLASKTITDRGQLRDGVDGERSIGAAVRAFNEIFAEDMTPTQGRVFMVLLKLSRASEERFHMDDYLDAAAYCALAGEEAEEDPGLYEKEA